MTHTIEESRRLVERVKASGRKLQVGVQGTSDESYAVANEHIKAGELGKIVLAQIDYSRNHIGDFWAGNDYPIDPDAKPGVNLDWNAWLGPAKKRAWDPERFFRWRRYWDYSGGIATDLFVHRATRIIKALDLKFPQFVAATGGKFEFADSIAEIPDTFNVLADYPGGPTLQLVSSMANDTPVDHMIRGHKATLYFTKTGFTIKPQRQFEKDVQPFTYQKKGAESVVLHHRNLQAAIRTGAPLNCDSMLGYYAVVVCDMAVQSYRRRQYLKWDAARAKAVKA
jgi:predicted dehydrogenase